jgi:hypothetical protein
MKTLLVKEIRIKVRYDMLRVDFQTQARGDDLSHRVKAMQVRLHVETRVFFLGNKQRPFG